MDDESAARTDARIGRLVDERYRVLEAMAAGSMGAVYKAERVPVGKLVAIKFLHAPFANDTEFLSRFERETRVMSKLNHPNCVSVVDFGVWEGAPYLVMEYVSGTTLRALIDNGPIPARRALALIRQIASGLAHAHAQGVVHRDVKPANIMISEEIGTGDHVRILDFGLARLRGAVGRDATQSNVVVGTPNYMAPEQTVGGGLIDARTDIYAVGVVLFEMICGDRPFQADDTLALLGMHRAAPIPQLADHMRDGVVLPRGLQDVVDKAMAKSPGDRFQSAIELAEAIDDVASAPLAGDSAGRILRGNTEAKRVVGNAPTMLDLSDAAELVSPAARTPAKPRSSFFGSFVVLAILLGGVTAAVWWVRTRTGETKSARATKPPPARQDVPKPAGTGTVEPAIPPPPAPAGSAAATTGSDTALGSGSAVSDLGSASEAGSGGAAPATGDGSAAGSAEPPGPDGQGSAVVSPPEPPPAAGSADPGPGSAAPPAKADSDIEMDPTTAEDPAPASAKPTVDDEAANAPKTAEEVAKRAPVEPARVVATIEGAVHLIEEGKRDLALASLHALWKKTPNSAYIPFLLGNVYFDQRWWSVAIDHYGAAIKKNSKYRSNPTLNRNVIRMLASNRTARRAEGFLKFNVGKPALPFVKYAALHDSNAQVKRLSGWLAKNL